MKFKILKHFRYATRGFGPGEEAQLAATDPSPEQLEEWQKSGLIANGDSPEPITDGERMSGDGLEAQLLRILLEYVGERGQAEDGAVGVLQRIIRERDEAQEALKSSSETNQNLSEQLRQANERILEMAGASSPTSTPLTAVDLSEIVGVKAASSLLAGGFDTREKITTASDKELEALTDVGEVTVKKLRETFAE